MSPTAILYSANDTARHFQARVFRRAGFRIAEASNVLDVRRFLSIYVPDALLLDAAVAPGDGKEVLREAAEQGPGTSVVLLGELPPGGSLRGQAEAQGATCLRAMSAKELVAMAREAVTQSHELSEESRRLKARAEAYTEQVQVTMRHACSALRQARRSALSGQVVLVAEDEPLVMSFLTAVLEHAGCLVFEASDGKQAVRLLWEYSDAVRIVLLDWSMPGMTGPEMVQTMRKISPEARLAVCSGTSAPLIRRSLNGFRVDAILEKPFDTTALLEAANRLVA